MKYKAQVTLRHDNGQDVDIEISGMDGTKVAHVANRIKSTFGASAADITHRVNEILKAETDRQDKSERRWYSFMCDFFKLKRTEKEIV